MSGRGRIALMAVGLALLAGPALAWPGPVFGYQGPGYQEQAYAGGRYSAASGQSYSRSVQFEAYGADHAGRPIDYAPGDAPSNFYPASSAYEAHYDQGYAGGDAYEARYDERRHGGYQGAAHGHAPRPPCPQMGGEHVVRCEFRPIYEEIRIDTGMLDGGVGVIPSGGGGGGGFVIVSGGGMASAGARSFAHASASASASASVSVRGGYRGGGKGGGCNSCGGKGGYGGKGH